MISSPDLVVIPARLGTPSSPLSQYAERLHRETGLSVVSVNPAVSRTLCGYDWEGGWDYNAVESDVIGQIGDEPVRGVVIFNQGDDRHKDGTVVNAIGHMAGALDGMIGAFGDEESPHRTFTSHGLPRMMPGSQYVACRSNQFRGPLISLRSRSATPLGLS